ncbi:MAG: Uma2 family endonuclease [Dehalococcoidia bacterium]|nr:Uma2 family endonuclease [Dehalococcoidia bacterium]
MVSVTEKLYTIEEFWALPEEMTAGCELIDGRIVKKHIWDGAKLGMTRDMAIHMQVVRLTWRALDAAVVESGLGEAHAEPTIRVGSNRSRSRRPDIAVIFGQLPTADDALLNIVPEMAVEVVSANNTAVDMFGKVEEYLAAGVKLVWQMYPKARTVIAFWVDRTVVFRPGDTITAEPVLTGFACPVTDLFPPPVNSAE